MPKLEKAEAHENEQLMLGAVEGEPALGRGPAPDGHYSRHEYHHPAAGWGAAKSVGRVLERAGGAAGRFAGAVRHEPGVVAARPHRRATRSRGVTGILVPR
jgi:hypothetical protein